MPFLKKLFNKSLTSIPALLLAICLLLGIALPSPALARMPEQFELKAADALLTDIQECTIDSLAGQNKWSCVEDKYTELLDMRLEEVNPSAHWCAAYSAWERGDVALTYKRLNLIAKEFPNYENLKIKKGFTTLKAWLQFIDEGYAPVKLRQPWFGPLRELTGLDSAAKIFAVQQLKSTRHFEGFLLLGEYTFGSKTLVVTADGVTEKEVPVVEERPLVSSVAPGSGLMVITYPKRVPRLFPSHTAVEWDRSLYGVMSWSAEADCLAGAENRLGKYNLQLLAPGKPIEYQVVAGTYWVATYLWHNKVFTRQEAGCREVVITAGEKTVFVPEISQTPAMVERQLHPPTQDFLDGMALIGPGFRSDSPTNTGGVGFSTVLEGRMTPEWWINATPNWTLGYQLWLDVRTFGTYTPAVSGGFGGTMGRDWYVPTKVGTITFLADGGLMLGTGVFGTNCSFNAAATSLSETDMVCGGGEGLLFPRLQPDTYEEMPAGFNAFYAGITARAMARLDVKNSGWYVGAGAWSIGQMFLLPGQQMDQTAKVVLTDGTNVEVPFKWGTSLVFRGQLLPGIVVGGRFP